MLQNRTAETLRIAPLHGRHLESVTSCPTPALSHPLFRGLEPQELDRIASAAQYRSYRAGTYVVQAGDPSTGLHIVLEGRVEFVLQDDNARELILRVLGEGALFGEETIIEGACCSESVRTCAACQVLFIPRAAVNECLLRNRNVLLFLLTAVSERVRAAEDKIGDLAFTDVHARVASVLHEHALESDGAWTVPTSSERIAKLVGASREMVCRVVKDMIRRGLLRRHKRSLVILDRDGLQGLSCRAHRTVAASTELSGNRRGTG